MENECILKARFLIRELSTYFYRIVSRKGLEVSSKIFTANCLTLTTNFEAITCFAKKQLHLIPNVTIFWKKNVYIFPLRDRGTNI